MNVKWELEDKTVVVAKTGIFQRNKLTVNGVQVPGKAKLQKKGDIAFDVGRGRKAVLSVKPSFVGVPTWELRIDGRMMVDSRKETVKCPACNKSVVPNDRFCAACGVALPTAEHYACLQRVGQATGAIRILAWLFAASGILMFFLTRSQADAAMEKLSHMAPDAILPGAVSGQQVTVAVLRAQIAWEPWGVLAVNLILALVMAILALWGKKSPLSAVLIATATYVTVVIFSAVVDPSSIAQGIYVKIIVIALLIKGIRSCLELRAFQAQ